MRSGTYPLSFPQQAILLDSLLHGPTTKFNMGGGILIRGPLDSTLFRQGVEFAFQQHDVQRMRIHVEGDEARQEFVTEAGCRFEVMDFSGRIEPFQSAVDWLLADIGRPMREDQFPLSSDVLFRLGNDLHLWYPKFHHIANDGYGHSLIAETVAAGYNGLHANGVLPELERHSYAGFISDDREYAASARFREDEAFWQRKFSTMPEPLPFTARKGSLKGDVLKTDRCTLGLHHLVYSAVLRLCNEAGVTPFQFLLAVLFAYLHRVTGRDDIVIGTPILNRSNHAFRRTAGMFMNMMPLRMAIANSTTVLGLARQIAAEVRACYRRQRFPFGEILRHCRTLDGYSYGVFDVTMIYRKLDYDIQFGGSPARTVTLDTQARDEVLSIEVDEYHADEDVNLFFNYNPQLISAEEAGQMARTFEALLIDVAVAGDRPIGELRLMAETGAPGRARRPNAVEKTALDLFARHATEAPGAVAIVDGATCMTYGELAGASNRVAAFLTRECGLRQEQPVAVLCDRNTQWIVTLMGIMKAGGAYLPLDPDAPRDRLEFILQDSGCQLLLAGDAHATQKFQDVRSVRIEDALRASALESPSGVGARSLAYIIYTSGTTGRPKGVLVEHAGLANTAAEQARGWELKAGDGVLQFSAPMFDASIAEIFAALAAGSRLVIAPKDVILDPAGFLELLSRDNVTVAILPPAYLSALGRAAMPSLRLLGTAGEAANPADVAHYNRTLTYVNAYGPTETSICASFLKLEPGSGFAGERVPIGKPLPHTDIYILNEDLQLMPVGAAGEICVGGVNVARGYLNRPDLTHERFAPSPFREGDRLYRTGDLGRKLPDGNIEFLGRRDTQVKIRGYRVELGEIETILKTHPAIETAAVLGGADGTLVAYVVARSDFQSGELHRFLAVKLPAYMIPSRWLHMPALPLNASGKVDRSALPAPSAEADEPTGAVIPLTAVENAVASIWEEVLGCGAVSGTDDFFELGGHSLKAIGILSRIQRSLGARVELKEFFSCPTVAQLATLIETRRGSQEQPILPAPVMDVYPLSHAQARIWMLSQMEGGGVAYNMPLALNLEGELDVSALEQALRVVIKRHESLRTGFVTVDGTPRQKIVAADEIEFRFREEDLRQAEAPEEEANRLLRDEVATPFDLTRATLMRVRLFRLSERRWLFSLVIHHIVGDGCSLEVLLKELASSYAGEQLPPLALQYKDYSAWMTQRLAENACAADRDFWTAKLAGPLPVLNLPCDCPRPQQMGFSGKIERFALPSASTSGLQAFCTRHGVSPFMLLLAGVFGLLHRYTGDEDMIIGTPVAGRDRLDLEGQVGLYLNTLALRVRAECGVTLAELLQRVRKAVLEAQEHQAYPFDLLIGDLKPERRTDRNPLFDVMVVMQSAVNAGFRVDGVESSEHAVPADVSVFDLTFHFAQSGPDVRLYLEYNTGLFRRERMERLASHLDQLLAAIISNPDYKLEEVDILSATERDRILHEFGEGARVANRETTVLDLFVEQAARTPDRTAVLFERQKLTYGELAGAASRLAARIESRVDAGSGSIVALVADRSEWMVAGVLGIMASGSACLPIDATLPIARIQYLLEDSGCQAVVSDGTVEIGSPLPVIPLRETRETAGGGPARPLAGSARSSDIAYVTYTSGSTGAPKGSLIEHRSLTNLVLALGEALYDGLPRPATELLLTSLAFDVALKQIFGALTRGNAVAIAGSLLRHDPKALMAAIVDDHIHLIDVTPAHFAVLLSQGFAHLPKPELKAIVLGSEALPCGIVEAFAKEEANRHIALFNFYGPSECTVETLFCRLNETSLAGTGIAPIGRPLANTRAYVLSPGLRPVPIGIPGEIYLGGTPVGRGYLNRPELNATRFMDDPFHPGESLYRTGDLGRWTADGQVEFLGREDGQLKVRGYRIEPGEVEHHLLEHPQVTGAVAAGRPSPAGSTELVAWYTAVEPVPDADSLRAHLRRFLPSYMVPARIVAVPELSLRANGKIDKDALPDPWAVPVIAAQRDLPEDRLEAGVHAIWQRVLGVENPGLDVGFFDAGGSSLLLAGLHSRIENRYPGKIKLIELFSASTVREQARLIRQRTTAPVAEVHALGELRSSDAGRQDRGVAIIGIGVRIGGRQSLDSLWEDLDAGHDFVRPMPELRRKEALRVAAALGLGPAELHQTELAYLDEIDKFDYAHFRIAPQKAALLDPREKIFLETAWHAIEDAGYSGARLKGTQTGVFLGESMGSADFNRVLEAAGIADANQMLESLTPSMAASRISYLLDLKGPALLVDTACSSALSALCLAVDALRSGRCDMALAGAIKLHMLPFRRAGRTEIESPDCRTHSFDDDAAGTGGGEASIAMLLKPLDRALADGDPIHAILRGAAMNQDGASSGITAPNAEAQAEVIDQAWRDAGIHPDSLAFIEAHGTGTRLGDPVEVEGLTKAFRRYTERTQFCALGSVKANIGHTDHAAGLAGLLRAVLCLEHRRVAPAIHFQRPNRNIRFEDSPLFVNPDPLPLERKDTPLLCGVSSFGLSGTNVHIVLEAASLPERPAASGERRFVLPLSARTGELLREQAVRLKQFIERHPETPLSDVVFTLATGREHLAARAAILFDSIEELTARLEMLSSVPENRPEQCVFFGFHKAVPTSKAVLLDHEVTEKTLERLTETARSLAGKLDATSLAELARLYVAGAHLPWESLFGPEKSQRCFLPVYPFERSRSWPEVRHAGFSLLGTLKAETPDTLIFESEWRSDSHWLLADHRIAGTSVLVVSAYLELAQQVARRLWNTDRVEIARLTLLSPLAVAQGESVRVVVSVAREKENLRLAIHSLSPSQGWQSHATAELARLSPDHQEALDIEDLRAQCSEEVAITDGASKSETVEAGPRWNCLRSVRRNAGLWTAELAVPAEHFRDAAEFGLYPPLLDVALNFAAGPGAHLPLCFAGVRIHGRLPEEAVVRVRTLESSADVPRFEIAIADRAGRVMVAADDYALKARPASKRLNRFFHKVAWTAAATEASSGVEADVLLVATGCSCEEDQRLAVAVGTPAVARTGPEWRKWLAAQDAGAEVKVVLLLPAYHGLREPDSASLDGEIEAAMGELFALSTALARRRGGAKLLVVGRLAHEVTGEELSLNPLHAAAAGFTRVPALETAAFQCRFLDADSTCPADGILREFRLAFASDEPVIAWRNGRRFLPRIEALDLADVPDRAFDVRDGATYLITGGTGGIGLELARYLANRARVTLLLVNRSMFPPRSTWDRLETAGNDPALKARIQILKEIESLGSVVHLAAADAAKREDMARLKREFPGVRGVFHCAGVGNDVFLANHEWQRLTEVLRPKVHGAMVLREVFGSEPLDAFVLVGSLTALTGAPGQAGYTAASAFQDAEACRLRRLGFPAQCLNWTAWKETGMAAASGKVADDEFRAITTADALLCLDRALQKDLAHVVVGEAALAGIAAATMPAAERSAPLSSGKATLLGRPEDNFTATERLLGGLWAEALGHTEMDIFSDFESLGGDSIANIGILERLLATTTFRPTLPDLLRYPTIESQAAFLDKQQFMVQRGAVDGREHLVSLGGSGSRTLFCFAPGSGSSYRYYDLARRLSNWTLYGVNFIETAQPASAMADILMDAQPDGDYMLLGYSIGGNMAYETALELESRGRHVRGLVFLDNWRRLEHFHFTDQEYRKNAEEFLNAVDPRYLALGNGEAMIRRVESYDRYMDSRIEDRQVPCPIRLIRAGSHELKSPFRITQEGWADLTTDFQMTVGSGRHLQMLDEPYVSTNAAILNGILEELAPADARLTEVCV